MTLINQILRTPESYTVKAAFLRRLAREATATGDLPLAIRAGDSAAMCEANAAWEGKPRAPLAPPRPQGRKPFRSTAHTDSVTVTCPCGAQANGEGGPLEKWMHEHLPHTDGTCIDHEEGQEDHRYTVNPQKIT